MTNRIFSDTSDELRADMVQWLTDKIKMCEFSLRYEEDERLKLSDSTRRFWELGKIFYQDLRHELCDFFVEQRQRSRAKLIAAIATELMVDRKFTSDDPEPDEDEFLRELLDEDEDEDLKLAAD